MENDKPKHPGGRPPYFTSPDTLAERIDDYFNNCPDKRKIICKLKDSVEVLEVPAYTICGLAIHLGFNSRVTFYNYKDRPEFLNIIKKAQFAIEKEYEISLRDNSIGAIFALKNMGWKDKTEVEQTTNMTLHTDLSDEEIDQKIAQHESQSH